SAASIPARWQAAWPKRLPQLAFTTRPSPSASSITCSGFPKPESSGASCRCTPRADGLVASAPQPYQTCLAKTLAAHHVERDALRRAADERRHRRRPCLDRRAAASLLPGIITRPDFGQVDNIG